jgi:predicted MFS family arabinose efflux permease
VLCMPIRLYIANHWNWQSPFLMIVGLATLIWLVAMFRLQPVTRHLELKTEKNAITHLWHTLRLRNYRIGFLTTALMSLGGFMMMPWGSAFAVNNLGVSYERLPVLFMVGGVASLFVMPLVGKLSDKFDKFRIFAIAAIWMMIAVIIYTNLDHVPFWFIIVMNIVMMIGIMSRMVPSMALVSALPQMQDRGAFMSINSSLQQIAGGIAAGVGGLIVVQQTKESPLQHFNTLGYVIVGIIIVSIIMVYRVNKILKARQHTAKL